MCICSMALHAVLGGELTIRHVSRNLREPLRFSFDLVQVTKVTRAPVGAVHGTYVNSPFPLQFSNRECAYVRVGVYCR